MLRHSVLLLISLALPACVSTAAPDSATRLSVHSAVEVEALIERADSLYSAGRFAEVIPLYERAVELN